MAKELGQGTVSVVPTAPKSWALTVTAPAGMSSTAAMRPGSRRVFMGFLSGPGGWPTVRPTYWGRANFTL